MNANEITFGIEIETHIPAGALPVGSYYSGAPVHGLPEGWVAKQDGSIQAPAGRQGCEFVSPVLKGDDGIRQILAVVAKLNEIGAKVNASTGLHVHVGWSGDSHALARLVTLVANFEKAIFASTGTKNRERGRWCASVQQHGDAVRASTASSINRYHVLNLNNLYSGRRATVEFRAFAGTLNVVKILGYVSLCLGLVERALSAKKATNFTAKKPVASSPIARDGEGQTELNRLFYQLGWTKGRTDRVYGLVLSEGAPSAKEIKAELMRLAKKYDEQA